MFLRLISAYKNFYRWCINEKTQESNINKRSIKWINSVSSILLFSTFYNRDGWIPSILWPEWNVLEKWESFWCHNFGFLHARKESVQRSSCTLKGGGRRRNFTVPWVRNVASKGEAPPTTTRNSGRFRTRSLRHREPQNQRRSIMMNLKKLVGPNASSRCLIRWQKNHRRMWVPRVKLQYR